MKIKTNFKLIKPEAVLFRVFYLKEAKRYYLILCLKLSDITNNITIISPVKIMVRYPTGFPNMSPLTSFITPKTKISAVKKMVAFEMLSLKTPVRKTEK